MGVVKLHVCWSGHDYAPPPPRERIVQKRVFLYGVGVLFSKISCLDLRKIKLRVAMAFNCFLVQNVYNVVRDFKGKFKVSIRILFFSIGKSNW